MTGSGTASLAGQVVIIIDAGRGIGRAVAERLALRGARIVVADIRRDRADAVAADLVAGGAGAISVEIDTRSRGVVLPVDGGSTAAGAYMVERSRRLKAVGDRT